MDKFINFIIFTTFVFYSCTNINRSPITNGNIIYVNKFEKEKVLSGEPLTFIESKGIFGCEIRKPYLFLNLHSQDDNIAVYDLKTKEFVGNYFTTGKSDDEYITFDLVNQYNDSVFWTIDLQRKIVREFSYTTQNNDSSNIFKRTRKLVCKMEAELFCAFPQGDMIYAYKAFSPRDGLYYENCKTSTRLSVFNKNIEKNDLNRIQTLAESMKPDGSKIVSFTGIWDVIDIISLNGDTDSNISITTSNELMTWAEYKKLSYNDLPSYYISIPRSNDKYIAVLHDNQKNQEILIFDWNGTGIAKCILKEKLLDFAVDWTNNIIYGITENEVVYQYEAFV